MPSRRPPGGLKVMTFHDLSGSQGESKGDRKQIYGYDFSEREQNLVNFNQGPQGS